MAYQPSSYSCNEALSIGASERYRLVWRPVRPPQGITMTLLCSVLTESRRAARDHLKEGMAAPVLAEAVSSRFTTDTKLLSRSVPLSSASTHSS